MRQRLGVRQPGPVVDRHKGLVNRELPCERLAGSIERGLARLADPVDAARRALARRSGVRLPPLLRVAQPEQIARVQVRPGLDRHARQRLSSPLDLSAVCDEVDASHGTKPPSGCILLSRQSQLTRGCCRGQDRGVNGILTFTARAWGLAVIILGPLCVVERLQAQDPGDIRLSFEVASIRENISESAAGGVNASGGAAIAVRGKRLTAVNAALRDIIRYAYQLETFQAIEGGPRWLDDRFD